ncbi:MAG: nucleotidyltransferase domain-containing protein [Candidatus Competibacterales bacterium]|nr:nucleotidyltransferase domain-containing protein [Candidatus Competibacterales bacterium]
MTAATPAIVQRLQAFFEQRAEALICVYLFGSAARGTADRRSDVDIAVLYPEQPPDCLEWLGLDLALALERLLGRPVDLVVLNRAPVDLIHRVLRDGVLICERDRSARVRFEVQVRNAYFDLLPYLRQYRKAVPEPPS